MIGNVRGLRAFVFAILSLKRKHFRLRFCQRKAAFAKSSMAIRKISDILVIEVCDDQFEWLGSKYNFDFRYRYEIPTYTKFLDDHENTIFWAF